MKKIKIISKYEDWDLFELLISFGLYEKFADDAQENIYVTSEQIAIIHIIQEIDKIKKHLSLK